MLFNIFMCLAVVVPKVQLRVHILMYLSADCTLYIVYLDNYKQIQLIKLNYSHAAILGPCKKT